MFSDTNIQCYTVLTIEEVKAIIVGNKKGFVVDEKRLGKKSKYKIKVLSNDKVEFYDLHRGLSINSKAVITFKRSVNITNVNVVIKKNNFLLVFAAYYSILMLFFGFRELYRANFEIRELEFFNVFPFVAFLLSVIIIPKWFKNTNDDLRILITKVFQLRK